MITVGFYRAALPVPLGVPLGGNARDDKGARGTHDEIHATVLAIERDAACSVLIGLDLLSAPTALVERIRLSVGARLDVFADVDVFATHTHSGPDVTRGMGFDAHDYSPVDRWEVASVELIADAVATAWARREPAVLSVGHVELPGVAFNRRLLTASGELVMNWARVDPAVVVRTEGIVDEELLLLRFDSPDGRPLGALLHFALHPAVLVGQDWLVSADFVAGASAAVSAALAGAPVIYASGALGDINHLDYTLAERSGGFAEAERIGKLVGDAAVVAARDARALEWLDSANVEHTVMTVALRQRTVDEATLIAAERLAADRDAVTDLLDGIPPKSYAIWTVSRGRHLTEMLPVDVSLLIVGRIVFVFVPFEVFSAFGLRLKFAFPDLFVKVVSLAGGGLGYLPTRIAFAHGGYEPTLGTSTIAPGEGEALFDAVEDRLRSRFPHSRPHAARHGDVSLLDRPHPDQDSGRLADAGRERIDR